MAKIDTLKDNFNDNSFDTAKWAEQSNNGSLVESGGVLTLNTVISFPNGSIAGFSTADLTFYDLTNSFIFFQLRQIPIGASSAGFNIHLFDATFAYDISITYTQYSNTIECEYNDDADYYTIASATYSATNHKWWKIRESGGTIYFDTSADGISWNNLGSIATATIETIWGSSVSSSLPLCQSFTVSSTAPTGAVVDNFNCPPRLLGLTGAGV